MHASCRGVVPRRHRVEAKSGPLCFHLAAGFISYPRTETDRFQKTIDVFGLVQTQAALVPR